MSDRGKRFLIKYNAVIGRSKNDGSLHTPVNLVFYAMVEAPSMEAASDMIVQHSDPGFVTKVESMTEVADLLSSDDLYALLKFEDVIQEMTG